MSLNELKKLYGVPYWSKAWSRAGAGKRYHVILRDGSHVIGKIDGFEMPKAFGGGFYLQTPSVECDNGMSYAGESLNHMFYYTTPIECPFRGGDLDQVKMKDRSLLDRLEKILPELEAGREKAGVE